MAPISNNRSRYVLGGSNKKLSTAPAVGSVESKAKKLTLDEIFIIADDYDFPREGEVPAGYFFAEVKDIQIRNKRDGIQVIDVLYEIEGCDYKNHGQIFHIKQSYVPESEHWKAFCKAMVKAGVKNRSNVKAAVGINERIRLGYVSDTSDFGSIVARVPYKEEPVADDEDDDALGENADIQGVFDEDYDDLPLDEED